MSDVKMVAVIATAAGHDGLIVRQPGEEFYVPESMFTKRPRLDEKGKPSGTFYDPPSWFKKKSPEREKAVRLREQAQSAAVIAEATPENKTLKQKALDLAEKATAAEKTADALDEGGDLA